jgi:shikimate dehydrogenase
MSKLPARLVLLGHPVAQSLSPIFQNAALQSAGIPLQYEAQDVPPADLPATIAQAVKEGWAGGVTIPYKTVVWAECRRVTPIAERSGAVNAFRIDRAGLAGHNTDVGGFDAAIRRLFGGDLPVMPVVALFGAGGVSRAVLTAIERWPGGQVRIHSRRPEAAKELAAHFPSIATAAATVEQALEGATVVVNATPLGLKENDKFPVDPAKVPIAATVLDVVYKKTTGTRWVNALRARGIRAEDGLAMLVEQGALAFSWWLGQEPDRKVMAAAVGLTPAAAPV